MKIICTVINDLTYDQRMHRICSSLAKAGHDVVLVGRVLPKSIDFQPDNYEAKRLKCFYNKGKLFYLEYNIRLFFFFLFSKFDVVCSIDLDTLLAGFFASKIRRKTCVYDAHEYFTEVPEVVERPTTKRIWEAVANFTIPKIKYAYTVGEGLAEIFEKKYGTPFKVIRNVPIASSSIDAVLFQEVKTKYKIPKTHKKILLYQGALNDGRGIEELILAVDKLENVVVWLAGEGDLSAFLREIVRERQLEDKVIFLGYVLPKDLRVLTKLADIGINLLQNKGLNYYYSLANKSFDYVQAEIPAIHVNFPEYQKLNAAHNIGVLADDLAPETLQNAIQLLTENPVFYNELVENCKVAKEILIWSVEEQKLLEVYELILNDEF